MRKRIVSSEEIIDFLDEKMLAPIMCCSDSSRNIKLIYHPNDNKYTIENFQGKTIKSSSSVENIIFEYNNIS